MRLRYQDLAARSILVDFEKVGAAVRLIYQWPSDFDIDCVENGYEGRASIPNARSYSPFSAIKLSDEAGPIERSKDYHLTALYGFTQQECRLNFFRKKMRTADEETLLFACAQIRDFYSEDAGHRKVISVIFAYRALDFGATAELLEAQQWLEQELATPYNRASAYHRVDATHQQISISMALWMVCLSLGFYEQLRTHLRETIFFLRAIEQPAALHAFNATRMILLQAYLDHLSGRTEQAAALGLFCFDFYKQCCSVAKADALTFGEMKEAHHAAWLALKLCEQIRKGGKPLRSATVFQALNRIQMEPGRQRLETKFRRFLRLTTPSG